MGRKKWHIPESDCNKGMDEERLLQLSSCTGNTFSCDDGECIDIENRCDGINHCNDLSDEKACQLVNFDPEKYLKGKAPPSNEDSLLVEVSTDIEVILDIQ